jgi:hypothetical protein
VPNSLVNNRGKEDAMMQDIRNIKGKLVCRIDEKACIVEIVQKGCKTVIHFRPDGTAKVINTTAA